MKKLALFKPQNNNFIAQNVKLTISAPFMNYWNEKKGYFQLECKINKSLIYFVVFKSSLYFILMVSHFFKNFIFFKNAFIK